MCEINRATGSIHNVNAANFLKDSTNLAHYSQENQPLY